ncbi:Conserved_hypothetical protein [Hexamita inflata]|uniref:Uncharacterized protein n=1 Tax=Hexamita inflata TaxID=28002 RepID=A0ABP1IKX8_9EUKA
MKIDQYVDQVQHGSTGFCHLACEGEGNIFEKYQPYMSENSGLFIKQVDSQLSVDTLIMKLMQTRKSATLCAPIVADEGDVLYSVESVQQFFTSLDTKKLQTTVQCSMIMNNLVYDIAEYLDKSVLIEPKPEQRVTLTRDISGSLIHVPRLKYVEFTFKQKQNQLIELIKTNISQKGCSLFLFVFYLNDYTTIHLLVPIIRAADNYWRDQYKTEFQQDIGRISTNHDLYDYWVQQNLIFSVLCAQNQIFYTSPAAIQSEVDETMDMITRGASQEEYFTSQTLASVLCYSLVSNYAQVLYEELVVRQRPVVSLGVLTKRLPPEIQDLYFAFLLGVSAGKCTMDEMSLNQKINVALNIHQTIQKLKLSYETSQDQFMQCDQVIANLVQDVEPQDDVQDVSVEEVPEIIIQQSKVKTGLKEPLQILQPPEEIQIDKLLQAISDAKNELKQLQMQLSDTRNQGGILEDVVQTNAVLKKTLEARQSVVQNLGQQLAKVSAELKQLNDDIVSGKRLERRWEEEIKKIHGK